MHMLRHSDLRHNIAVKLTIHRKRSDDELLDAIMSTLARCVILRPDFVGFNASQKHGLFGVAEPHPFPELAEPVEEDVQPTLGL